MHPNNVEKYVNNGSIHGTRHIAWQIKLYHETHLCMFRYSEKKKTELSLKACSMKFANNQIDDNVT
jgi:hypothetical protein